MNWINSFKRSLKFSLFYSLKSLQFRLREVIEDIAIHLKLDSEYELHYRISNVQPSNKNIQFYEGYGEESITPQRPSSFTDTIKEYPRKNTASIVTCSCGNGRIKCPNCNSEGVVTCPKCYTHRGGDCYSCKGVGKVQHYVCRGTGVCQGCMGKRFFVCPGCGGTGKVTVQDTHVVRCPDCGGNYDNCPTCLGFGWVRYVTKEVVAHSTCGGTGYLVCSTCYGSGKCPGCGGTGIVTCSDCRGTGICQFCRGKGVKTCPTCNGNRYVTCPVCEGVAGLILYTADVYEHKHLCDTSTVVPELFGAVKKKLDEAGYLQVDNLTSEEVERKLNLMNKRITKTVDGGVTSFERLKALAEGRIFIHGAENDREMQKKALARAWKAIENDWENRGKDSYYETGYKLSLTSGERKLKHEDIYNKILFQKPTFLIFPLSLVSILLGGREKRFYVAGTKDRYSLEDPGFKISPVKASLFTLTLISAGAIFLTLFGLTPAFASYFSYLAVSLAALLSVYIALITRDVRTKEATMVTLIGEDETNKMAFFTLMAHYLSMEGKVTVEDEIYTRLTEHFLGKKFKLGSSLSYLATLEDGGRIRFLNLSSSSYKACPMDQNVNRVLADSDAIIVFLEEGNIKKQEEEALRALNIFGKNTITVVVKGQVEPEALGKYSTIKADFDSLKKDFLKKSETTDLKNVFTQILKNIYSPKKAQKIFDNLQGEQN